MIWRVRSQRLFSELRTRGTRVRSGPVRMTYLPVSSEHPQLAFGLGRRFGNAVDRNRARRRLRAAFETAWRSLDGAAPTGAFLVTADRQVLSAAFDSLVGSVRSCLLKADQQRTAAAVSINGPA